MSPRTKDLFALRQEFLRRQFVFRVASIESLKFGSVTKSEATPPSVSVNWNKLSVGNEELAKVDLQTR